MRLLTPNPNGWMLAGRTEATRILTMSLGGGKNNCDGGKSNKKKSDAKKKKNIGARGGDQAAQRRLKQTSSLAKNFMGNWR